MGEVLLGSYSSLTKVLGQGRVNSGLSPLGVAASDCYSVALMFSITDNMHGLVLDFFVIVYELIIKFQNFNFEIILVFLFRKSFGKRNQH